MLVNNYFQYKRINEELKQYNTNFIIESIVKIDEGIEVAAYGFKYEEELYYIVRGLTGKYMICKLNNHKIQGTYAEDLSLKQLRISLKNILN